MQNCMPGPENIGTVIFAEGRHSKMVTLYCCQWSLAFTFHEELAETQFSSNLAGDIIKTKSPLPLLINNTLGWIVVPKNDIIKKEMLNLELFGLH